MSDRAWKRVEREVALILWGQRIPQPGRQGVAGDPGDVAGTPYYVEVRVRKAISLLRWWQETRAAATVHGRPPLLAIKEPCRGGELLAVLRLHDLAEVLHAKVPPRTAGPAGPDPGPAPAARARGDGDSPDRQAPYTYTGWCWICKHTQIFTILHTLSPGHGPGELMRMEMHRCPAGHDLIIVLIPTKEAP